MAYLSPLMANTTFPSPDWESNLATPDAAINKLLEYSFPNPRAPDRKGVRSDGLVIIRGGKVVLEQYQAPYDAQKPHLTWSVSKSFINALYGVAEHRGLLKRSDSVSDYYPLFKQEGYDEIRIEHLLHWTSGLDWAETYEASPLTSSVVAMLYTLGRDDMAAWTARHPIKTRPGQWHNYSSGDTNLLSATLRGVVGESDYPDFPWQALFEPLGMSNVTWEQDASGTYVGSSYLYATPRDMARLGYLFLRKGNWNGEQLLSEDWVQFSSTLAPAYGNEPVMAEDDSHPGAHWWVNSGVESQGQPLAWPDAPADTYTAWGHWGQYIFVIPSLDLVIARTGDDRDGSFNRNLFLSLIVAAFGDREARQ
ncbi:beta-lactamase family protein [Aestuariirhabdus sp. Z084]|uniref:serine hydrolase domain-containing protein n=1 Tax=Aestuariirhabdus haliotis TaxID=2918751 RepID=UPI00201B3CD4|nr:serine hydrolase [Aestuariirhabdus haliotis]MCL6416076.1 beta-lactamase family protein [Aestuariirhabdus haliotis]MCL6419356.1 beta-lactamase family protein [Aestuariirhabdus haliotis]